MRIRAGAPSSSIDIDGAGNVGVGTDRPATRLHVVNGGTPYAARPKDDVVIQDDGPARLVLVNTKAANPNWVFNSNDILRVSAGTDGAELTLDHEGNMTIRGTLTAGTPAATFPDYVFEPDYPLMPMDELAQFVAREKRLPKMPSAAEVGARGLNMTEVQILMLEKIEELTLYTLQLEETVRSLQARDARFAALESRLAQLETQ